MNRKVSALILAAGLLEGCAGAGMALQTQSPRRYETMHVVNLQYRIAHDSFAPSKFVGVVGNGITPGLSLVWELPVLESDEQKLAQREELQRFHRLLALIEERQINGVEFECACRLDGFVLYATAVPRLTKKGLRQIEGPGN